MEGRSSHRRRHRRCSSARVVADAPVTRSNAFKQRVCGQHDVECATPGCCVCQILIAMVVEWLVTILLLGIAVVVLVLCGCAAWCAATGEDLQVSEHALFQASSPSQLTDTMKNCIHS